MPHTLWKARQKLVRKYEALSNNGGELAGISDALGGIEKIDRDLNRWVFEQVLAKRSTYEIAAELFGKRGRDGGAITDIYHAQLTALWNKIGDRLKLNVRQSSLPKTTLVRLATSSLDQVRAIFQIDGEDGLRAFLAIPDSHPSFPVIFFQLVRICQQPEHVHEEDIAARFYVASPRQRIRVLAPSDRPPETAPLRLSANAKLLHEKERRDKRNAEILSLIRAGWSYAAVGRRTGVTGQTVKNIWQRHERLSRAA